MVGAASHFGSSESASSPSATANAGGAAVKRGMENAWDADEAPGKTQKLNSVCVGLGSSDKAGESLKEEYEEDLKEMVEAYKTCSERGGCFVHIRKKQSSNRDLRALSCLTKGTKLYKVNLVSSAIESVITNSSGIAKMVKAAGCDSVRSVEKVLEEEVKGKTWEQDKKGFEQHMAEEEEVRLDWKSGGFEKGQMKCETCGVRNAWNKVYNCRERQCAGILNALQAFPFAAWDDISSAPLNPEKVVEARKLEISYAENKPVWKKNTAKHGERERLENHQVPMDRHQQRGRR